MTVSERKVIVGLGKTGYSCARYFHTRGIPFAVVDDHDNPPYLQHLQKEMPEIQVSTGAEWRLNFRQVQELIVSPGVPLNNRKIVSAIGEGVSVTGDIDLFRQYARAPIVAITGSNGKSTVTTMVGQMATRSGLKVGIGGNLGVPALDLLGSDTQLYVLELSSFQLETTEHLAAKVATILNISSDHLDRYASEREYRDAKERIFDQCSRVVVNRAEETWSDVDRLNANVWSFGEEKPSTDKQSGLGQYDGRLVLMLGEEMLLPVAELKVRGKHNVINALASIVIADAADLPLQAIIDTLRSFEGLPFRCALAAEIDGVEVYNDSKATNVGSTLAAVCGLAEGHNGKLILIAGGEGKGADFTRLRECMSEHVESVILFGRDSNVIQSAVSDVVDVVQCFDMETAFLQAMDKACAGDVVLFSPACASFDMFRDYVHRGESFDHLVNDYVNRKSGV